MNNLNELKQTTPVHDFPDIYNANNQELVRRITALEEQLAAKTDEISKLEFQLNQYAIKSQFARWFDEKMREFDGRIQALEGDFDNKMSEFNNKFVKKDNQ